MASPAQSIANRANAQRSTGPRTPEGKAAVANNARTHGLTAAHPLVRPGEETDFEALSGSLRQSLHPEGALEEVLLGRIVHASWNLQRLDRLEAGLLAGDLDPLLNDSCAPAMDRILRYRATAERSLYRGLKEFRTQQTMRAERVLLPPDMGNELPPQARSSVLAATIEIAEQSHGRALERHFLQEMQKVEAEVDAGMRICREEQASRQRNADPKNVR